MKKTFFLALGAALLALAGCNKNAANTNIPDGKSAQVTISIKGSGEATKAAPVADDEVRINAIDAFVFNSNGDLDAYGHYSSYSSSSKPILDCTTGAGKRFYVIINSGWSQSELSTGIATEADLKALVFQLSQNRRGSTLDNFQMISTEVTKDGNSTIDLTPGANEVKVTVSRVVSRVWIRKITRNFTSGALSGPLTIKGIYVSNVTGSYGLDGSVKDAATDTWYNKYDGTATQAVVTKDAGMAPWLDAGISPVTLAQGANSTAIESTFYVMPNQTPYDAPVGGSGAWSPRNTKLVVETEYAGRTYYYAIPVVEQDQYPELSDPASFQGLRPNYSYRIDNLELTRLGSTNPDEPVLVSNVSVEITVAPWQEVILATENGKYVI